YLWGIFYLSSSWYYNKVRGCRRAVLAGMLMGWVLVLRSTMILAVVGAPLMWLCLEIGYVEAAQALVADVALGVVAENRAWGGFWRRFATLLGWYVLGGLCVGVVTLSYFLI